MKYLKHYENSKNPKVGDYVICNELENKYMLSEFIANNIGLIVRNFFGGSYQVKYENIPDEIKTCFGSDEKYSGLRGMFRKEIIDFESSKEKLEMKLNIKKYNL